MPPFRQPGFGFSFVRSVGEVPAHINFTELENIHEAIDPQNSLVTSFKNLVAEGAKRMKEGVDTNNIQMILDGAHIIDTALYLYMGGSNYIVNLPNPPYAALVPRAVDCYLTHKNAVRETIPAVATLDDEQIQHQRQHLGWLQVLLRRRNPLNEGYARVEANLAQDLFGSMARIYNMGNQAISANITLSYNLEDLTRLCTQGAVDSLESRKNNEKVAEKARDNTVEEAKAAVATALKQTPQAPGQTPLQINLDALKSNRNRNRGKDRDT